jgi:NADPH2:quinone reductase
VITTAGSAEKCRAAESFGAERAVDYRHEDFVAVVQELTAKHGVDVILDIIGGSYLPRNLECLARDGRLVQIGLMGGDSGTVPLRQILLKRLTITGSTLRIRTPQEKGIIAAALEREVWPVLSAGRMTPVVSARVPLANAAEAHRMLEGGQVVGKVVLLR